MLKTRVNYNDKILFDKRVAELGLRPSLEPIYGLGQHWHYWHRPDSKDWDAALWNSHIGLGWIYED